MKATAMSVRVLVVDDFQAFRQYISQTLEKKPELQVISKVSDGEEEAQAQTDLLLATENVLQGKEFISSRVNGGI